MRDALGETVIFEEDYRGHTIRVVAGGHGQYRWRFTIDGDAYTSDGTVDFRSVDGALRDGHSAARFEIDLRLATGFVPSGLGSGRSGLEGPV
jgi:hypothetical protein